MARAFASASSQYLSNANAIVTASPCTMACWGYLTTSAVDAYLMSVGASTTAAELSLRLSAFGAVGAVSRSVLEAGDIATSSTSLTDGVWGHACAVFRSTTSRDAYLNGAGKGSNASLNVPLLLDRTWLANIASSGGANYLDGYIAEAAIWNIDLSDAEVARLATGISPLMVRPEYLVAYWPLIGRDSPEPDYVGGFDMTLNGAPTQVNHVRIYNPRRFIRAAFKIAGAVTTNISVTVVATGVVALTKTVGKIIALIEVASLKVLKQVGKLIVAVATGVVAVTVSRLTDIIVTAVATGVVTVLKQVGKITAATGTGTVAIGKTIGKITTAVATGVSATVNLTGIGIAAVATGTVTNIKQVGKVIAVTATGVASVVALFIAGGVAVVMQVGKLIGIKLLGRLGIR